MGRTQPCIVRQPAHFRRGVRAKEAKSTLNTVIPRLLSAHPRAKRGIEEAELFTGPLLPACSAGTCNSDHKSNIPRISLQVADTLTAAHALLINEDGEYDLGNRACKVAILNMGSPLSPGGGVLNGANSQEESLCRRTTLLPSLNADFYRLPELGAVYTRDVLVFKNESDGRVLEKRDRWFVDCVTAAMLRMPDCEHDAASGRRVYDSEKDRDLVLAKMRTVLHVCQLKGAQRLVLGAWGCGAYGNPVGEIASAWRKALLPHAQARRRGEADSIAWKGIKEVVFAIKDPVMASRFADAFGRDLLEVDEDTGSNISDDDSLVDAV